MSVNTIVKLCGVLNISADFLLLGMEEPDGTESPLSIYVKDMESIFELFMGSP